METFSQELTDALSSDDIYPVWLLKLDLVSASGNRVLYLSDRAINLWDQDWAPLVFSWGVVDRYFDPDDQDINVSDVTITLSNVASALGSGEPNISWFFRAYDLGASNASLYLWLDNANLTPPAGNSQNDLIHILSGRPELSAKIDPFYCPLDIVAEAGPYASANCSWGELLQGHYYKKQWPSLPKKSVGKYKPVVFGPQVHTEGVPLSGPIRAGSLSGPTTLFDSTIGSSSLHITFPEKGAINANSPYPTPCDIYVGDWKFSVKNSPYFRGAGVWEYLIHTRHTAYSAHYLPTPLMGATPTFTPAVDTFWSVSSQIKAGPFSTNEPAIGIPYQFHHGTGDSGSPDDGDNSGRHDVSISKVSVDGIELSSGEVYIDNSFGIAWLKYSSASVTGAPSNPKKIFVPWTSVDTAKVTGDQWLRAANLTALQPRGYNVNSSPSILGNFAIPASGGGSPAESKLALYNSPGYPVIGVRIASVRFVFYYTGAEVATGTFNLKILGRTYSFAAAELINGAGIAAQGFSVALSNKGRVFEIWLNNNGQPITAISPKPREWEEYELSLDVTDDALAHIESVGALAGEFEAWFSDVTWPATSSVIVLKAGFEIEYDPATSMFNRPTVTALVDSGHQTAGDILSSLVPVGFVGAGFDDPLIPSVSHVVNKPLSTCAFARKVLKEIGYEMKLNVQTALWDLIKRGDLRDNSNPAPPTGGAAVITQDKFLTDDNGTPMIERVRSGPESLVNEITVHYVAPEGTAVSQTFRDEGSLASYGLHRGEKELGAGINNAEAKDAALKILNDLSEPRDFYQMTFPLGLALSLSPNDILEVTADMDMLAGARMRVVSVEIDPGNIAAGKIATVTVNAQRYSISRRGFGRLPFGLTPFGLPQIVNN